MNGFRDHDELYWNAIGDVLGGARRAARPRPSARRPRSPMSPATQGRSGSTASCDKARILEDGTARFRQSDLFPFEAFTVVVALPEGRRRGTAPAAGRAVEHRPRVLADVRHARVCPAACSLLLIAGCGWLLWTRGRDRRFVGSPIDQTMGNATGDAQAVPLFERGVAPGRVRAARGPPARAGRHDHRRAGEHARRHRDDRGPGRPRLPDDRGDPEGRVVRQAGLDAAPDGQGRRRSPHVRADAADRAVQGRERSHALQPASARSPSGSPKVEDQLYADAVKRGWFVKRPDKVRASWHARGALLFVAGLVLTFVLAKWTTFGLVGHPGDRGRVRPHGRRAMDAQPDGEGHRDRPARRRVPHRDRDRGDPHVTVGGGAERLHPVPPVRHRVRTARRSGRRRSRGWRRCRPTRRGTCPAGRSSTRTSDERSTTSRSRPEARSRRRRRPPARAGSPAAGSRAAAAEEAAAGPGDP